MTRERSESCGCKTGFFRVHACPRPATAACGGCGLPLCSAHAGPTGLCPACSNDALDAPPPRTSDPLIESDRSSSRSWSTSSSDSGSEAPFAGGGGTFGGGGASGGWEAGGSAGASAGAGAALGVVGATAAGAAAGEDGFTAADFAAMESVSDLRPDRDRGSSFES